MHSQFVKSVCSGCEFWWLLPVVSSTLLRSSSTELMHCRLAWLSDTNIRCIKDLSVKMSNGHCGHSRHKLLKIISSFHHWDVPSLFSKVVLPPENQQHWRCGFCSLIAKLIRLSYVNLLYVSCMSQSPWTCGWSRGESDLCGIQAIQVVPHYDGLVTDMFRCAETSKSTVSAQGKPAQWLSTFIL